MKDVIFDKKVRDKLRAGINRIGDPVRITMGHKGRAVLIQKGVPTFTLDGVTVAESIDELEDRFEDMGASIVKKVARSTNDAAGDGTTTGTVLVQELANRALGGIDIGLDPLEMRDAIEKWSAFVIEYLKKNSRPVNTKVEMAAVATISSRDPELGKLIAELYDELGPEGLITTEETKTVGVSTERVEGMQVDNGWAVPHFMTNIERHQAVVEKPYILVTTQNLTRNDDILPILEQIMQTDSKSIVIVAEDVAGEALATLVVNKLQGRFKVVVIKAPGLGDSKKNHLEDICAITGATLISEETGLRVDTATLEQLGRADKVIAYKNRSIIIGGKGKKETIEQRVKSIKSEITDTTSHYKKLTLEKRVAKLSGGVAIIRVGDVTEEATKEKMYRIEDAVNATRSAIEEGVVEGGGMALYRASLEIGNKDKNPTPSWLYGINVLKEAIQQPAKQIIQNAGGKPDVELATGYKVGEEVIDPVKVPRVALSLAVSQVGLMLITGAAIVDKREPRKK